MSVDTKIDICSRALILIGENPISSFDPEEGNPAIVASNLYDAAKRQLLASYPWRFASTSEVISRMVSEKVTQYDGAYQLPSQCLRPQRVRDGSLQLTPFEVFGTELHLDSTASQLDLDYLKLVNEDAMTEWFVEVLQTRLAAMFAVSITASPSLAGYWDEKAEMALRRARFSDSLIDSPNTIEPTRLVQLRR